MKEHTKGCRNFICIQIVNILVVSMEIHDRVKTDDMAVNLLSRFISASEQLY